MSSSPVYRDSLSDAGYTAHSVTGLLAKVHCQEEWHLLDSFTNLHNTQFVAP